MKRTTIKRGGSQLQRRTELARGSKPLRSKTRLRSKSATNSPKKRGPCSTRGCTAIHARVIVSESERYCAKHGTVKADDACRAYSKQRQPFCVACGRGDEGVQWAHVETRGARFIRWDARNFVSLCARCHYAYTKSPARWHTFIERTYPGRLSRLLRREAWAESQSWSVPVAEVIRSYRAMERWEAPDPPDGVFVDEE